MGERTEVEWTYDPADFLEAAFRHQAGEYLLTIDNGKAVMTLKRPLDPVPKTVLDGLRADLRAFFRIRQLQVHRSYTIGAPWVNQYEGGRRKSVAIHLQPAVAFAGCGRANVIVKDATGKVIHDSKAERVAQEQSLLLSVAPKLKRSPTLRALLDSYQSAVNDPANELVHLYEIRDALAAHYGGEQKARRALNICRPAWQRIGKLADTEPLEQGRHRGKHLSARRSATTAELEDARRIVRQWVLAFAQTV